jgi:Raf kinase inhibitor-like YbhB/YbcL family protein
MDTARVLFITALFAVSLFAQQPSSSKPSSHMSTFTLASPAFRSGAAIPDRYTCRGSDDSPALVWTGLPAEAASFAIIMDDPDAPAGTWVHWVIWNIPATSHLLQANVTRGGTLADGAMQGKNGFGKVGYNGPCPPPGKTHRYFFRLYALDSKLTLQPGATRKELDDAMKGHILGKAEHMGTYFR